MSKESKHTSGPHYAVNYAGYIKIQVSSYYGGRDLLDADAVGMETAEANGRLYAAAPDMLEVLESMFRGEDFYMDANTVEKARSAIKKARGL